MNLFKLLFFQSIFFVTVSFSQYDTVYILHEISSIDRFWFPNRLDMKLDKMDKKVKEPISYYKIPAYRRKLEGKDSTFTGVVAFCCESAYYGVNNEGVSNIMYDETCTCKQFNTYEKGIIISTEKKGNIGIDKTGYEKCVFDTDTSQIFINRDLSGQLTLKTLMFWVDKKLHTLKTDKNNDTLIYSISYRVGDNSFESVLIEKNKDFTRKGLFKNEKFDENWKYIYNNQVQLTINYSYGQILDFKCDSLIFLDVNGKVVSKNVFFEQLKTMDYDNLEKFCKQVEKYIVPISSTNKDKKTDPLLLIRVPSRNNFEVLQSNKGIQKIVKEYYALKNIK